MLKHYYFKPTSPTQSSALSLHDALPISGNANYPNNPAGSNQLPTFEAPTDWAENYGTRVRGYITAPNTEAGCCRRSEEHTSELQSHSELVCRLLLEKKKYGVMLR